MNPILAVAEFTHWQTPPDELFDTLRTYHKSFTYDDVYEALSAGLQADIETDYLETVARLCLLLAMKGSATDLILKIHFDAGMILHERFDVESLRLAVAHFQLFADKAAPDESRLGLAYLKGAVVRCKLTEMFLGEDPFKFLLEAIQLCKLARRQWPADDPRTAEAFMVEGTTWVWLGDLGHDPMRSFRKGVIAGARATRGLEKWEPDSHNAGAAQLNEGTARAKAAEFGIQPGSNLAKAVRLFQKARRSFGRKSPHGPTVLANEGAARVQLADLGPRPVPILERAVALFERSRKTLNPKRPESPTEFARSQANEGTARLKLGLLGVEPVNNLQTSITLHREARRQLNPFGPDFGNSFVMEAQAHIALTEFGMDQIDHLQEAVALCRQARTIFQPEMAPYHRAVIIEGQARFRLAQIVFLEGLASDALTELEQTLAIFDGLLNALDRGDPAYGAALVSKADAILAFQDLLLSNLTDPMSIKILESEVFKSTIELCKRARQVLPKTHPAFVVSYQDEGLACLLGAKTELSPTTSIDEAIKLFFQADGLLEKGSLAWIGNRANEGAAWMQKGDFTNALPRLRQAAEKVEELRTFFLTEQDRINYFDRHGSLYATIVKCCLELADETADAEKAEQWRAEAWHWVHRGKSRTLMDMLAGGRPRLRPEEAKLWSECEQLQGKITTLKKEIAWIRDRLSTAEIPDDQDEQDGRAADLNAKEAKLREAEESYHPLWERLLTSSQDVRTLQGSEVPDVHEVARCLRKLAQGANGNQKNEGNCGGDRPVAVEFCVLGPDEIAVFLLQLWNDEPPSVLRWRIPQGALMRLATEFLTLTATGTRNASQDRSKECWSKGTGELAALAEPWIQRLEDLQPTLLMIAPHSYLNLLPLHMVAWGGRMLVEHCPVVYLPTCALAQEIIARRKPLQEPALVVGNPTSDLIHSSDEAQRVASRLIQMGFQCDVVLEREATQQCILMKSRDTGIFHFAGHTRFNHTSFRESGLELADGRLTVSTITSLLEMARNGLVVLSSCESAMTTVGHMDEFQALVRVFFYAGSPTILGSLWRLDETSANSFMDVFYKSLVSEGMSVAKAWQQAMLATKALYSDPSHWGAFVLYGDWTGEIAQDESGGRAASGVMTAR